MDFYLSFIFVLFNLCIKTENAVAFSNLNFITPKTPEDVQSQSAKDVICRLIPEKCSQFDVSVDKSLLKDGKDTFTVIKMRNKILITGSSGVACTWGFHYYLKNHCNCHIGWQTKQLSLPETLPDVNIIVSAKDRFRYYQNVCTTSYSFVWWDVKGWQDHIDWMALNGFNIALASHGQELIWQRVYRQLTLTDDEIDDHFSGPAFLSWQRMGNIRGWAGPLSSQWHHHSLNLEHFITDAMTNLGIVPVLPAFAGYVPRAFKRVFPNASFLEMEPWNKFKNEFCCPLFLDPIDPLFNRIGKMFLSEMASEFGLYHVYNSDPFNENKPSSGDMNFLKATASSIYKSMSDVDPDAVWLLQGWMFLSEAFYWLPNRVEAFLTAVEKGRILVLDLQSEQWPLYDRFEMYYGQPFIWCMLHNFGGTLGMFGDSQSINEDVYDARLTKNSTMVGTGLTPEGINQNYIIYELMMETSLRDSPVSLNSWTMNYTIRRYGIKDESVVEAWNILMAWYKSVNLLTAWKLFLNSSSLLNLSECYRHDLTDITRQVLQYRADQIYPFLVDAFTRKDLINLGKYSKLLMSLFQDLEAILASNKGFLLGNWLESAKSIAQNDEDAMKFEHNARNQITLWGPQGEIIDYANKQWSGVVSDFFAVRWKLYLSEMYKSVKNNYKFNKTVAQNLIFSTVERPFTYSTRTYPTYETGDTIEIAKTIFSKWSSGDNNNYPDVPIKVIPKFQSQIPNFFNHFADDDVYADDIIRDSSYQTILI